MTHVRRLSTFDSLARYFQTPADRGLLAESFPGYAAASSTAPSTAGRLEFAKLRLAAGASVTNIVMHVVTIGVTLTSGQCKAALFDSAGALVGTTADQSVAWVSTGTKTMALASGPFSVNAGFVFVGFWYNGTTSPAWARAGGIASGVLNGTLATPNFFNGTADTGLTTTAPGTMGAQTGAGAAWWIALS